MSLLSNPQLLGCLLLGVALPAAEWVQPSDQPGHRYLLHEPVGWPSWQYPPVIVACHGAGDTFDNFAAGLADTGWVQAADDYGFLLVIPEHRNPDRASFLSLKNGSTLDGEQTAARSDAIIDLITDDLRQNRDIDLGRIFFLGFSEGAHFADLTAYWHMDQIAGALVYAGGVPGKDLAERSRDPVLWFVAGDDDPLQAAAIPAAQEWNDAGVTIRGGFPPDIGHNFRDLSKDPTGDPDNATRICIGAVDDHATLPQGRPDEVLRRITIRHDGTDELPTWQCRPGPRPWPGASAGAARFPGLHQGQDHLLLVPASAAEAAATATTTPTFILQGASPDGSG